MEFDLDRTAIEAVFDVPDSEGAFTAEQQRYLQNLGARRPCIFLAFPPKAAGTFLRQAVIEASGGNLVRVVHAQGGRDAQPYLPTFLAYYHGGICNSPLVAHVHMQALPANLRFVEAFGLKPVVMVRNIPDMLASFCDMLDDEPAALRHGLNGPLPQDWLALSDDRKVNFLIDMLAPWYVSFFATWFERAANADGAVLIVTYKDFLADPAQVLHRVLGHSGLDVPAENCAQVIEAVWTKRDRLRFNRGKEGRASGYFSTHHLAQLERMMSYYPALRGHQAELLGY